MRFCESLPKLEVLTEVSKFANQSDNEVDYKMAFITLGHKMGSGHFFLKLLKNLRILRLTNIFFW